jgi:hypothetical protein
MMYLYEMETDKDQTAYVHGRTHDEYLAMVEQYFKVLRHAAKSHRPNAAVHTLHTFKLVTP